MTAKVHNRVARLERFLYEHKDVLFKKQHRDGRKRKNFSLAGSFKIGLGSTQPGNLKHIGKPGFVRHNFMNTAAYVRPVEDQKVPALWKKAYRKAMRVLRGIDPGYAEGETVVQFAYMSSPMHYVARHRDANDISHQYAMSLGDYKGATLRVYDGSGKAHDMDNRHKIVKFDGRLPHEVIVDQSFHGERFTVIYYKNYDSRKSRPDPVVGTPSIVFPMEQQ